MNALESIATKIINLNPIKVVGHVTSISGNIIQCTGLSKFIAIGSVCKIISKKNNIIAEVIGFKNGITFLMPYGYIDGINPESEVMLDNELHSIYPSITWKGRILNCFADPIDTGPPLTYGSSEYLLKKSPPLFSTRQKLDRQIDLGVRSIDTFVSCCYGQRIGIFAGSGVGKSMLISMLTKYACTDIKVIGLIGERSREVQEFVDDYLGPEGLQNAIIIVSTGDESALMRKRATYLTVTIAEFFRDNGLEVLCIIDSITRFAIAQREIGLSLGEPVTTRGFTPSVFSELPKILERTGPGGAHGGNITGLFTVLVEGDDHNEPISDAVRGILDGHIVLDREIANRGRFPAVNVLKSISRTSHKFNTEFENKVLYQAKKLLLIYDDMKEIIRLGAYKTGSDPEVDAAITCYAKMEEFLTQKPYEYTSRNDSYKMLHDIVGT